MVTANRFWSNDFFGMFAFSNKRWLHFFMLSCVAWAVTSKQSAHCSGAEPACVSL